MSLVNIIIITSLISILIVSAYMVIHNIRKTIRMTSERVQALEVPSHSIHMVSDRVQVLETHHEVTQQTTCSVCKRQVARYSIDSSGHVKCANCDPEGYKKHLSGK